MDRTTTGSGKVVDHTWAELQTLRLKDTDGNVTDHRILTLSEVIDWTRGKTVLDLDQKDVPFPMIADLIRKYNVDAFVMLTVHTADQARYYYQENKNRMFSAFVKTPQAMVEYEKAGIFGHQMIVYVGPKIKSENQQLYRLLHEKGVVYDISRTDV